MAHCILPLHNPTQHEAAVIDFLYKVGEAIGRTGASLSSKTVMGVYETEFDGVEVRVAIKGQGENAKALKRGWKAGNDARLARRSA